MDPRKYTDPPGGIGPVEEEPDVSELTKAEFDELVRNFDGGFTVEDIAGRTGRHANFLRLLKESRLEFGGAEQNYEGERYLVLVLDGDIGDFATADNLREVAGNIGDYIESAYGVVGWYDLDEAEPVRRGWKWMVTVNKDDDEATEMGVAK